MLAGLIKILIKVFIVIAVIAYALPRLNSIIDLKSREKDMKDLASRLQNL